VENSISNLKFCKNSIS